MLLLKRSWNMISFLRLQLNLWLTYGRILVPRANICEHWYHLMCTRLEMFRILSIHDVIKTKERAMRPTTSVARCDDVGNWYSSINLFLFKSPRGLTTESKWRRHRYSRRKSKSQWGKKIPLCTFLKWNVEEVFDYKTEIINGMTYEC